MSANSLSLRRRPARSRRRSATKKKISVAERLKKDQQKRSAPVEERPFRAVKRCQQTPLPCAAGPRAAKRSATKKKISVAERLKKDQQKRSVLRNHPQGPHQRDGSGVPVRQVSWDLGFVVMRIQEQLPDCEAMRKIDDQHWQLVKIEFEKESRNFLRHGHLPSGCDLIVCWVHNWPECPVEVIELRTLRVWGRRE